MAGACFEALPAAFCSLWKLSNALLPHLPTLGFLDLGSGFGSLVVLAGTLASHEAFNIGSVAGLEKRAELHAAAQQWLDDVGRSNPLVVGHCQHLRGKLHLLDLAASTDEESVALLVRKANVVFCNNMLFSPELNAVVAAHLCNHAKPGSTVVVSTAPLPPGPEGATCEVAWLQGHTFPKDAMSWTAAAVQAYVYTIEVATQTQGSVSRSTGATEL